MFGWFRSLPNCPIETDLQQWIEKRWQWILQQFGESKISQRPVVLPNFQFFPEPFQTGEDIQRLFDRLTLYMELNPIEIQLSFYEVNPPFIDGAVYTGTAMYYEESKGRYMIGMEKGNLSDPLQFAATAAHQLAYVHLFGHRRITSREKDFAWLNELLTVYFGLGILTANAVIQEDYWTNGQLTGWTIGRVGYMTMPMYGYALAMYARARHEPKPAWAKLLRPDVRVPFRKTFRYWEEQAV